jgi:ABC-type multidrug transport system permease subunit
MLRLLLIKDLRRVMRNPVPWLTLAALPLFVTAVIALTFGGGSSDKALGRIRFALVDEDDSMLARMLRAGMNQGEARRHLEPVLLGREEAMRQVNNGEVSAVLIIPAHFTRDYLSGNKNVSLDLIKNPAESIHPAVMEELLGVAVTALNALSRNFQSEFPDWRQAIRDGADYHALAALLERAGRKLETIKKYIDPPLVVYGKEADAGGANAGQTKDSGASSIFAGVLIGMSTMFLLLLAVSAMNDLNRELRFRTFERYQTLRHHLLPFIAGKVLFGIVLLLLCAAMIFGGGGLAFQIAWRQPLAFACLVTAYCAFAAGLMALMVALIPDERHASVLNNVVSMGLSLGGGCMVPPHSLPHFLGAHITPLLPTYWFLDTAEELQYGAGHVSWIPACLKIALISAVLIASSVMLFHRRFHKGDKT